MDEFKCEICDKTFKYQEGLDSHNKAKHEIKKSNPLLELSYSQKKKIKIGLILIIFLFMFGGIIYFFALNVQVLPPVSVQGHIEVNPPSHILKEPMDLRVQKHMLEHSDGIGPPGIIINYNCIDFECEEDLILKLENFAKKYPLNVYVAPFKGMTTKIVLTKSGKLKKLNEFDEKIIEDFIKN